MAKAATTTEMTMDEAIEAGIAQATPIQRDEHGREVEPQANGVTMTPEVLSEFERLLQKQVETAREREDVPIQDGKFVPKSVDGLWRLAKFYHAAGMLPKGVETVYQVFLVLSTGAAVKMDPTQSLKNIMIVNNRCSIWGDGLVGIARASGRCEYIDERIQGEGDQMVAICETKRKDEPKPVVRTFSVADAKRAGLWGKGGPWTQHPKRMLAARARTFCLRDAYADFLGGLSVSEEMHEAQDRRGTFDSSRMRVAKQSEAAAELDAEIGGNEPSSPTEPGGARDSVAEEPASPDADSAGGLYT